MSDAVYVDVASERTHDDTATTAIVNDSAKLRKRFIRLTILYLFCVVKTVFTLYAILTQP